MKVHLKALGCRLNEAELERWSGDFLAAGHHIAAEVHEADVVVLNTCAVTTEAGSKSRRLMNRLYRENPAARLVVSGCHATLQPDEVARSLGVDLVVPNATKDRLPAQVMEAFSMPVMPMLATEPGESGLFMRGRHRAFIKIQDGCRYRCTFCIVTVARGAERSRSTVDIIAEINRLHEQGIREVVLAGVHVGGYGSDLGAAGAVSLSTLVNAILRDTDMPRIRFASVEPWDLPDSFFGLFANPRLMPHMHLPIQSGSDSVLRRMARRCKTTAFSRLVQQARAEIPGFNVTTDIIVGFPGETDAEWEQTLAFVEQTGFGHLHIFSYSPREGTKAANLPDPVPEPVKKQRSRQLHRLGEQLKQVWLQEQYGQQVAVLLERPVLKDGRRFYTGYTPNYCRVLVSPQHEASNESSLENTMVSVRLQASGDDGVLLGECL
ncbi:MAG TPA: tRNA (N(6)-L-threonylcarbamoyladenosine(37)-C(2))-methylthiotransferase MtaB [Thiolinea sp.]|nr:tRNA (N(6)-L-threonylcarbamoyladenosine(37)-C(2))-methylthiotransferase MtaB [Thiolinea sp.]